MRERVLPGHAELALEHGDDLRPADRRHVVLQVRELGDVLGREQVGTCREDLAELRERRAELLERLAQAPRAVGGGPHLTEAVAGEHTPDLRCAPEQPLARLLRRAGGGSPATKTTLQRAACDTRLATLASRNSVRSRMPASESTIRSLPRSPASRTIAAAGSGSSGASASTASSASKRSAASRAHDRATARIGHGEDPGDGHLRDSDRSRSVPPDLCDRVLSADDLCLLRATEQAGALRAGAFSARELVEAHLARIERIDPLVNAIVTRTPERALAAADEADRRRARGDDLPALHGLPIAHKDLQDTAGVRTTYGSPSFREHVPEADSLQVARLREAGAILVGKTNTPEWGAGSHTFNPVFGATRNAWDATRSAGGSSGGGAVALACRMLPIADGSDLGGSLRNPAAWSGVTGCGRRPA